MARDFQNDKNAETDERLADLAMPDVEADDDFDPAEDDLDEVTVGDVDDLAALTGEETESPEEDDDNPYGESDEILKDDAEEAAIDRQLRD